MSGKSEYVKKLEQKLEEFDNQYRKLREKARIAKIDAEIEYKMELEELKEKRDNLQDRLAKITAASEQGWESLRDGFEKAYEEIKIAFKDARSKFK